MSRKRQAERQAPRLPFEESPLRILHRELPARSAAIQQWFFSRPAVVARMASLPHAVQQEIRLEVRGRAMGAASQGRDRIDWQASDVDLCRSRVVSRLRVARYGRIPDDPETHRQQRATIEAELG